MRQDSLGTSRRPSVSQPRSHRDLARRTPYPLSPVVALSFSVALPSSLSHKTAFVKHQTSHGRPVSETSHCFSPVRLTRKARCVFRGGFIEKNGISYVFKTNSCLTPGKAAGAVVQLSTAKSIFSVIRKCRFKSCPLQHFRSVRDRTLSANDRVLTEACGVPAPQSLRSSPGTAAAEAGADPSGGRGGPIPDAIAKSATCFRPAGRYLAQWRLGLICHPALRREYASASSANLFHYFSRAPVRREQIHSTFKEELFRL